MSLIGLPMRCCRIVRQPCILSSFVQLHVSSLQLCTPEATSEVKVSKKKTTPVPKITLISGSSLSITTLEEAQKLSKRRDLKLVKMIDLDTKTQRPVYKLMTGSEYYEADLKQREERKKQRMNSTIRGEKLLLLNDSISDHDLEEKARKASKWISKSYQVHVVISGRTNTEKAEQVYNRFEKLIMSEARILQKRVKGTDIKFQIIPPKKENKDSNKEEL